MTAHTDLWRVDPLQIWRYLRTQPASFWLVCFYLFIEYVRPQQIYTFLDILPWGKTTLVLAGLALLHEGRWFRSHTIAGPLLGLFTLIVVASSFTAYVPAVAFEKLPLYLSWVYIFFLITNTITTEKRFFIFMLSFLLYSFKMSQHGTRTWIGIGFGFQDWGATGAPGWFHNSGEFGIQMCVFFPLAVHFYFALRKHWGKLKRLFFLAMPVTAVMSMIASSSRGALVGGAVVLMWMVSKTRYRVRATLAAAVVTAIVVAVIPPEQMDRLRASGEDQTSVHRLTMWKDGIEIANDYPILGIGYGNWRTYYMEHYSYGLPHNIFIEAVAELGYSGLIAFLLLIGATFHINRQSRRIAASLPGDNGFLVHMGYGLDGALVGYLASGFFVTVLYYPYFWINLAQTVALNVAVRNKASALLAAERSPAHPGHHVDPGPEPATVPGPDPAPGTLPGLGPIHAPLPR